MLGAEGLNELDVLGFRARLDEDAKVGLTLVERLRALAETASETVVDEGVLQDLLSDSQTSQYAFRLMLTVNEPEEHPQRTACPWGRRWKPRPQPQGRRLEFHLQRQTSCRKHILVKCLLSYPL